MRITKLQAARNHLRTACALWFADTDPISVHTLAYAAHEVIHRIYRSEGNTDLLYDTTVIKDEFRNDFAKTLKKSANFFKHADRETKANDSTEFNPELNELLLMTSITGLQRLGQKLEPSESALLFWLYLHHPAWFPQHPATGRIPAHHITAMREAPRPEFFKAYIAVKKSKSK